MKVGIIDYEAGNLQSVANAFKAIGADTEVVQSPEQIEKLTHLVLPGQGEFGDCASKLKEAHMFEVIREWIAADKPFLGICVGYQLLFEGSDEAPQTEGLGVIKGWCKKFSDTTLKVPHMGWNSLELKNPDHHMWQELGQHPYFYYVHSYFPVCEDANALACTTHYGETFHGAIAKGKLFGSQFHPEKSQYAGLQLLKNFLTI